MKPEGSLPHSQASATCPYPVPAQSSPHPTSWKSILILSTHLRLGLPSGLFPSGYPTKTLYAPSPHPYATYAQPISFFSILSPAQYCVSSTDHSAPRHAISSIPPLIEAYRIFFCFMQKKFCRPFDNLTGILTLWRLTTYIWVVPHR